MLEHPEVPQFFAPDIECPKGGETGSMLVGETIVMNKRTGNRIDPLTGSFRSLYWYDYLIGVLLMPVFLSGMFYLAYMSVRVRLYNRPDKWDYITRFECGSCRRSGSL